MQRFQEVKNVFSRHNDQFDECPKVYNVSNVSRRTFLSFSPEVKKIKIGGHFLLQKINELFCYIIQHVKIEGFAKID